VEVKNIGTDLRAEMRASFLACKDDIIKVHVNDSAEKTKAQDAFLDLFAVAALGLVGSTIALGVLAYAQLQRSKQRTVCIAKSALK
jgi:hypothetical protein